MNEDKIEQSIEIERKINRYNNSPNLLQRVSTKFGCEIEKINDSRIENGFGELSNPKITELIVRHKLFSKIKEDIIHFDINLDENNDK